MSVQAWVVLVNAYEYSGNEKGAVLEATETETAISPGGVEPGQACIIPADYLKVGTILRYTARGIITPRASTATAITFQLKLVKPGEAATTGQEIMKQIYKTTAVTRTNQTWKLEATSRIIKVGKEGRAVTQGEVHGILGEPASETVATGVSPFPITSATGGESANLETGKEWLLVLTAKWGAAIENKITCFQWLVEALS